MGEIWTGRQGWRESKFRINRDKICASTNALELSRSSRINADLIGEFYSTVIPVWTAGNLADLGCGKAPLLGAYRDYCSSILLADWAESMHANPLLDVVIDLNEPLSNLASNCFDTVILSDVLEHIRQPTSLLAEIFRILRPGGHLLMNVPFIYNIHEAPHDYFRYTRYALDWMARDAGLEVIELVPLGGGLEVMGDLLCKALGRVKLWLPVVVLHKIVMSVHRTPLGRRFAQQTGEILPIGYGMVARKKVD